MARVFLGIGSNIRREQNLRSGLNALRELFQIVRQSSVYESDPVGFEGDPFFNLAVEVETELPVAVVQQLLRRIEDAHGRDRSLPGFGARALDIDILLCGSLAGCIGGVTLPREEILQNAFVLWPLAEIAPEVIHPVAGKSLACLWEAFDKSRQVIMPVAFDIRRIA